MSPSRWIRDITVELITAVGEAKVTGVLAVERLALVAGEGIGGALSFQDVLLIKTPSRPFSTSKLTFGFTTTRLATISTVAITFPRSYSPAIANSLGLSCSYLPGLDLAEH